MASSSEELDRVANVVSLCLEEVLSLLSNSQSMPSWQQSNLHLTSEHRSEVSLVILEMSSPICISPPLNILTIIDAVQV